MAPEQWQVLRRGIRCDRWYLHPLFLPLVIHLVLRCNIQETCEGGEDTWTCTKRTQGDGQRECADCTGSDQEVKPWCHGPCKWVRVTDGKHGKGTDKEVEEGLSALTRQWNNCERRRVQWSIACVNRVDSTCVLGESLKILPILSSSFQNK